MIIIIDFDNTITNSDLTYPEIDEIRIGAREIINKYYDMGHCIIINTCRCDEAQKMAEEWLIERGIKFCHINENCEMRKIRFGNDTRKIGGAISIDDKNVESLYWNGKNGPDWYEIDIMLEKILNSIDFKPHELCDKRNREINR